MPSYLDLALVGVVFISAVLAAIRGFTREVLTILSWALAAISAYYFFPLVLPYLKPYIPKEQVALIVAVAAVFLVTLVIVSLITVKLSDIILDSKIGALDRSLGFLFGIARGYFLALIAFMFFAYLMQDRPMPSWIENSKTRPWLVESGEMLKNALPGSIQQFFFDVMKPIAPAAPTNQNSSSNESPSYQVTTPAPNATPTQKDRDQLNAIVSGKGQ